MCMPLTQHLLYKKKTTHKTSGLFVKAFGTSITALFLIMKDWNKYNYY